MSEDAGRYLSLAALSIVGLLGAWTARACHKARLRGEPGSDAAVWAALAAVFLLVAETRLARAMGLLRGWGSWLRHVAMDNGFYAARRPYQIGATVLVLLGVVILMAIGIAWAWDYIKRYRLAVGFAGLAVGFGLIRFISLHEVDAWNARMPWVRVAVDLIASAGASTVALTRLRQLGELDRLRASH